MDEIEKAYGSETLPVEHILGTQVASDDPDRQIIEPWAATVSGPILDVGSGTGRWAGHLATLGHDITGLEPAERLIRIAQEQHPAAHFRHGSIADLEHTDQRWAGILAWYSIIHMGPAELHDALTTLRTVLEPNGTLLMSFFSGPAQQAFAHPVATAYRWPMPEMVSILDDVGFEVTVQHWDAQAPHAYLIARATASESSA